MGDTFQPTSSPAFPAGPPSPEPALNTQQQRFLTWLDVWLRVRNGDAEREEALATAERLVFFRRLLLFLWQKRSLSGREKYSRESTPLSLLLLLRQILFPKPSNQNTETPQMLLEKRVSA